MVSKVLNIIGILLMVIIIAALVAFNAPRLAGYQVYGILSESMEPVLPSGSIIYAKTVDPSEIQVNDIIVYPYSSASDLVVAHRVIEIQSEEEQFVTKGDANTNEDSNPILYDAVLGKVVLCIPIIGNIFQSFQTVEGKIFIVLIFIVVFLMWIVADRLKENKKNKKKKI